MINPEFFDIFGLVGFLILLFSGIKVINSKDKSIKKYGLIITIISILGIIIDGYVILRKFVLN